MKPLSRCGKIFMATPFQFLDVWLEVVIMDQDRELFKF